MVVKLRKSVSRLYEESQKESEKKTSKKSFSKVEEIYVTLTRFATHCLSSIALETGGHSPLGSTVTKSAAFNALFRRTYNLKIIVFVSNIITGLITTGMMIIGDRYGVPYLYLPWLINTMKCMILHEGPTLLNLANVLLPNITFASGSFILTTFLLYVEQLCIWNDAFRNFQRCWTNYHYRVQSAVARCKDKVFTERMKKLRRQECTGNVALEKFGDQQGPVKIYNVSNNPISMHSTVRAVKSTVERNNNYILNEMLDLTG